MTQRLSNHIPLVYPKGSHITVLDQGAETIVAVSRPGPTTPAQLTLSHQARLALASALVAWRSPASGLPETAEIVMIAVRDGGGLVFLAFRDAAGWRGAATGELITAWRVYAWAPLPVPPDETEVLP